MRGSNMLEVKCTHVDLHLFAPGLKVGVTTEGGDGCVSISAQASV